MEQHPKRLVLGSVVADLDQRRILEPGDQTRLTERECRFLEVLTQGIAEPTAFDCTPHVLKQVVYRLRKKLPEGVIETCPLGHVLSASVRDPGLLGRQTQLFEAEYTLHSSGSVTLIGPAGAGKTRLARSIADRLASRFEVLWIDARQHREFSELGLDLCRALELADPDEIPNTLEGCGPLAVILDNLEQVSGLEDLLGWRQASRKHRWLSTSRLAVTGTPSIRLGVLDQGAAIAFLERRGLGEHAADLARHVDPLPLALDLLASQCQQKGARAVLALPPLDALDSMRSMIQSTWISLTMRQRDVLAAASTFAGTFPTAALHQLAGTDDQELAALQDTSLLERGDGDNRMLSVVRAFIHDQRGERIPWDSYATVLVGRAELECARLEGPDGLAAYRRCRTLEVDLEQVARREDLLGARARLCMLRLQNRGRANLNLARLVRTVGLPDPLARAIEVEHTRALMNSTRWDEAKIHLDGLHAQADDFAIDLLAARWSLHMRPPSEAVANLQRCLDRAKTDPERAAARLYLTRALHIDGRVEEAESVIREVFELDTSPWDHFDARIRLALTLQNSTRHLEAVALHRQATALAAEIGDVTRQIISGGNLAICEYTASMSSQAAITAHTTEQLSLGRGDLSNAARMAMVRSALALDEGRIDAALATLPDPQTHPTYECGRLLALAWIHLVRDDPDAASKPLEIADGLASSRNRMVTSYIHTLRGWVAARSGRLEQAQHFLDAAEEAVARLPGGYWGLLLEQARLAIRVHEKRHVERVYRVARTFDVAGAHPEVRRGGKLLQRYALEAGARPVEEKVAPADPVEQATDRIIIGDLKIDLEKRTVLGVKSQRLTRIEASLLRVLVLQGSRPVHRDTLLREVWGYGKRVKTRTLDQTIYRLRRKIEPNPGEPDHLVGVYGVGYRLVGAETQL